MGQLVRLLDYIPTAHIDLKYASTDNFAQKIFYPQEFEAQLVKGAAEQLAFANEFLNKIHPEFRLVIWDAARPHSVQLALFKVVKNTPQEKYIAHPDLGSLHNYGCAIDVGIINEQQQVLDFGTEYDYFGELAEPSKEIDFLHQGLLAQNAISSRALLRYIMVTAGFQPIPHEWWHFNYCSLDEAKKNFERI